MSMPYTTHPCPECGEDMLFPAWGTYAPVVCTRCGWQQGNGKVERDAVHPDGLNRKERRRREQIITREQKRRKRQERKEARKPS